MVVSATICVGEIMNDITPGVLNTLYDSWLSSQCPILYDELLQAIITSVHSRYKGDGKEAAEAISTLTVAKVFRALPGYTGPHPLKPYDPARCKFSGFVFVIGRTTRVDYKRKQSKQNHIVYSGSSTDLEYIHARTQDPWNSDGRRRVKKLPSL